MKKLSDKTLDSYRQALATMIKERRQDKNWSQAQLAAKAGIKQSRVSEMEAGEIKSIDTFIRCVNALEGQIQFHWK
jgi:transcriptional regulator with XRE-family HTH domain